MRPQRDSRLRLGYGSLDAAVSSFYSADYDECLKFLGCELTAPAITLRARSLIRMRREDEGLAVIASALKTQPAGYHEAEWSTVRVIALTSLGRFADAKVAIDKARGPVARLTSAAMQAEFDYAEAMLGWSVCDYEQVNRSVHQILSASFDSQLAPRTTGQNFFAVHQREVRAKAYDLLGVLAAVRENYDEQAALVVMAFEELDKVGIVDKFFETRLLYNLAVIARDLDLHESFDFVSQRVSEYEFSPCTKLTEFNIRRALGWCSANRGNHLGALRQFRLSADAAPSIPWRIIAILDRALLARELHESHSAQEELDYALRLYQNVDWEATRDEERSALLILAQHLAASDPAKARVVLNRHESLTTPLPFSSLGAHDRRFAADIAYGTAQVLRAEGRFKESIARLMDCYEVWTQIGYTARAASAAADLAELTHNRHYLHAALREAERRPQSWFATRLRSVTRSFGDGYPAIA